MTEHQASQASTGELAGVSFACSCGHPHAVGIQTIRVADGVSKDVAAYAAGHRAGKPVLVVSDNNTWIAQGQAVAEALKAAGVEAQFWSYQTTGFLIPDEKAVGELVLACPRTIGLIVAVGSGTLNDLCRIVSDRTGIPYVVVCTAPSVDGYTSTVSPLILAGHKTTLDAVYPQVIFADPGVLRAAPSVLLQAGFGDLLGKVTALSDWELSRRVNGEYHCPTIEGMVRRALDATIAAAGGVAARDPEAVTALFDALVLSGLAMGMIGNSRPASGAEHHLSHYWEMDALKNHQEHALHGNAVGSATVAIARTYELMRDRLPPGLAVPDSAAIRGWLKTAGSSVTPADLGNSRDLFRRSMLEAMHVRPRYTVLRLAADAGRLAEIADRLTVEFYG
jgi:glycerol-1-phosphate dehydrogenase [NAD(P)+]